MRGTINCHRCGTPTDDRRRDTVQTADKIAPPDAWEICPTCTDLVRAVLDNRPVFARGKGEGLVADMVRTIGDAITRRPGWGQK